MDVANPLLFHVRVFGHDVLPSPLWLDLLGRDGCHRRGHDRILQWNAPFVGVGKHPSDLLSAGVFLRLHGRMGVGLQSGLLRNRMPEESTVAPTVRRSARQSNALKTDQARVSFSFHVHRHVHWGHFQHGVFQEQILVSAVSTNSLFLGPFFTTHDTASHSSRDSPNTPTSSFSSCIVPAAAADTTPALVDFFFFCGPGSETPFLFDARCRTNCKTTRCNRFIWTATTKTSRPPFAINCHLHIQGCPERLKWTRLSSGRTNTPSRSQLSWDCFIMSFQTIGSQTTTWSAR